VFVNQESGKKREAKEIGVILNSLSGKKMWEDSASKLLST